jgi:hypothetical protein
MTGDRGRAMETLFEGELSPCHRPFHPALARRDIMPLERLWPVRASIRNV